MRVTGVQTLCGAQWAQGTAKSVKDLTKQSQSFHKEEREKNETQTGDHEPSSPLRVRASGSSSTSSGEGSRPMRGNMSWSVRLAVVLAACFWTSCKGQPPTGEPPEEGPCAPVFSDQCDVLTDDTGPFAGCHVYIDADTYFQSCVFDICATQGEIFCENLETYYDACVAAGGTPFDWRTPTNCHPDPSCTEACVEGCECNDGFILSGQECVPLADCGCSDN
ncbi:hypothetical protein Bbelb_284290 [Branchiostoma belcheri]|nr:hypothetical protein Bbelb_284290 [Branchiostoma belcheri]